ncbi:MAG: hypothetical protein PHX62_02395 [Bacilli bacterium]|nr:hypothetical protein [Bacilli bacterium]
MEHLERGKEILKILINNGCEAYLIGEAVCNTILEIPFEEVEITTSATPDMVKGIFADYKVEKESDGYVRVYYLGYPFLIGTFKMGISYRDDRRPLRVHYSKNLHDELATRDYTINAIAMSHAGKLTDAYRGFDDIQKKKIKTIGSPKVRFHEKPLRMLVGLRFVSELDFRIEKKVFLAMKRRAKLISNLDVESMKKEIKRIINGKYFKKALKLIVESGIYKRIPVLKFEFKRLSNRYRKDSLDTFLACSFVKAGGFHEEWSQISANADRLRDVVTLALERPKGDFSAQELFILGLDICLEANKVNRLLKRSRKSSKHIRRDYLALPIRQASDLNFTMNELNILTKERNEFNNEIFEQMVMKVLIKEIPNDYHDLREFVIASLANYLGESFVASLGEEENVSQEQIQNIDQIEVESQGEANNQIPEPHVQPSFLNNPVNYSETISDNKYNELEDKIKKLERQNLELKLERDVDNLVGQNLDILGDMYSIDGSEKVMVSRELKGMYRDIITNVDPKLKPLKGTKINKERNLPENEKED